MIYVTFQTLILIFEAYLLITRPSLWTLIFTMIVLMFWANAIYLYTERRKR